MNAASRREDSGLAAEESQRVLVDRPARADCHEFDHAVCRDPVDDPESAHTKTPEIREFTVERLARGRVGADQVEAGPDLDLEPGMESSQETLDPPRYPQTIRFHEGRDRCGQSGGSSSSRV